MPGTNTGSAEDALFRQNGEKPGELFLGTPVAILEQGSTKPIVFHLEDADGAAGQWVVKAACRFKQGSSAILRELAASDLCTWFGLKTPKIGLMRLPKEPRKVASTPVGEAAADIYRRDAGKLALCSKRIDGVPPHFGALNRKRKPSEALLRDAITLFAMDILLWNFDRAEKNPNALLYRGRIVPIDHDRAFHNIDKPDPSGCAPDYSAEVDLTEVDDHITGRQSAKHAEHPAWDDFCNKFQELTDGRIVQMAETWPDELDRSSSGQPLGWKADCVRFLAKRRECVAYILSKVRHALARR